MHAYAAAAKDEGRALFWVPVVCLVIAGAVFGALYVITKRFVHGPLEPWIAPPGLVAVYQTAYRTAWNRWVWRWPLIHRFFGVPDVQGSWLGRVEPSDESGIPHGTVALVIEQRWLGIRISFDARLDGDDGSTPFIVSHSLMAAFVEEGGDTDLRYEYDVRPGHAVHGHRGVAHLHLDDSLRPTRLSGTYFTDQDGDPQHWGALCEFTRKSDSVLPPERVFALR